MEVRYMGFEQLQNARAYQFDVVEKGQSPRHATVTADLALFHTHSVGIQEGPGLSANKLTADLEHDVAGPHELTAEDLLSYASARAAETARRVEKRKAPRPTTPRAEGQTSWGHSGPRRF